MFSTSSPPPTLAECEQLVDAALQRGNFPLAEIICRHTVAKFGPTQVLHSALALIAANVGLLSLAIDYGQKALALDPKFTPATEIIRALAHRSAHPPPQPGERFLLIKAWGAGFWSEIDHLLGQLLLAEITGRTPVVHWGVNSLFRSPIRANAFENFFQPVSTTTIDDIAKLPGPYFPPKWTPQNLHVENLNKVEGPGSRLAGLYFLARPEEVAVADFFTGIVNLLPWIPPAHPLHGKTIDDVYRTLFAKYIKPRPDILAEADAFYQQHMLKDSWLGVHIRAGDKHIEDPNLDEVNRRYEGFIATVLSDHPDTRIFLLTDDENVVSNYTARYGPRLLTRNVTRTKTKEGVHRQNNAATEQLGREVLIDALLAARCDRFLGNGSTNLSALLAYIKPWPPGHHTLIKESMLLTPNWFLHQW